MASVADGAGTRLRILHVAESSGIYGKERIVLELMRRQAAAGDRPALLTLARRGTAAVVEQARREGFWGETRPIHGPLDPWRLRRLVRAQRAQLLHAHDFKSSLALAPLRRLGAVPPLVRTLHGNTSTAAFTRKGLYEATDRRLLRWHDALVAVTPAMRGALPLPLEVIENGIAPPPPAPAADPDLDPDLVRAEAFARDALVLGCLSRLSAEKNLEVLVDAVAALRDEGLPAKLILLGEGPGRAALEARIARLMVGERVWLPGFKGDVRPWLARFSLYLQPSLTEGLPIALLEAMHAGVPMLVTPAGGMNEILGHGAAIPIPFDGAGIAAVVRRVWTTDAGRAEAEAAATRGREQAATRYDSETMARAYRRLYQRVVAATPAPPGDGGGPGKA